MLKKIKKIIPTFFKDSIVDLLEIKGRYFPKEHKGYPHLDLSPTQTYPYGINFFNVITNGQIKKFGDFKITKEQKIASIGSCFAEEIGGFLTKNNFNYMVEEENWNASSAKWGRVYSSGNINEIVNYSLSENFPILIQEENGIFYDPIREKSMSATKNSTTLKEQIKKHRFLSKQVFNKADLLIITVGQNESWYDKGNNVFLAKRPSTANMHESINRYEAQRIDFNQNVDLLQKSIDSLLNLNPKLKIIFTVSPVSSEATFLDEHVIARSFGNKCILRAAVDHIVEKNPHHTFYFPSFEMIFAYNPTNFRADNRHVKRKVTKKVMTLFKNSTGN